MYLENINETHVFSSFGTTFINSQAKDVAKTITFTEGYNLDSNLSFKVLFENGHITDTDTAMTLNNENIKVYINGILSNLPTHAMTVDNTTVYTSLQEGTILELFYNGSSFVIVGNPLIYSNDDYEIYANGDFIYKKTSYTNLISASGENNLLLGDVSYSASCYGNVGVSSGCPLRFNPSTGTLTTATFSGALSGNASTSTLATCANTGKNGNTYSAFGSNAFNSTTIATKVSQLQNDSNFTDCVGTVTSINVSVNGVSGTAVTSSGTITLNNVNACNSTCFGGCTYDQAKADFRNYTVNWSTNAEQLGHFTDSSHCWLQSVCIRNYFYDICWARLCSSLDNWSMGQTCSSKSLADGALTIAHCNSHYITICACCKSSCGSCFTMEYYYNITDILKNRYFITISCSSCRLPLLDLKLAYPHSTTGYAPSGICYTSTSPTQWSTEVNYILLYGF